MNLLIKHTRESCLTVFIVSRVLTILCENRHKNHGILFYFPKGSYSFMFTLESCAIQPQLPDYFKITYDEINMYYNECCNLLFENYVENYECEYIIPLITSIIQLDLHENL